MTAKFLLSRRSSSDALLICANPNASAQLYPRRADLERRRLPMSANPAKPINSIAGGGISGTDGCGMDPEVEARVKG
jgi:hypothetical protein